MSLNMSVFKNSELLIFHVEEKQIEYFLFIKSYNFVKKIKIWWRIVI